MKPMLASDYDESKLRFPLLAQPKIDGVRALNMTGTLTGRSLKKHANRHVTGFFSHSSLAGLDGETAAEHECHPDLCRITSSALSTIDGTPWILWHLFDYVTPETVALPYRDRYAALVQRVAELKATPHLQSLAHHLSVVPSVECASLEGLLEWDNRWLDMGYEGTIIRSPGGAHKQGRSTVREGGLLRIKRFIEEEAEVLQIIEGETNLNEAQTNELGKQFRTSHQENLVPNGQVGAMMCRLLKDVIYRDKLLFEAGTVVKVAAGSMTVADRVRYFKHKHLLIGQVIKFKLFPKGVKDKPRFPTFQSIRIASDQA